MRRDRLTFKVISLFVLLLLLPACASSGSSSSRSQPERDAVHAPLGSGALTNLERLATPTPTVLIPSQHLTPTPRPTATRASGTQATPLASASAPYGPPPPLTDLEQYLTQKLFEQINSDRAAQGLYPYTWNATLAAGARLHSWNMYHCGFSHTCPDGLPQCTRIANEGFSFSDCGENIGLAGPSNPAWTNVYQVQESMANEPATGWHHIHLFSTTLHRVGIGVYVDPSGWVWFTEDFVS
ncbi:CAP domain-containing protein [Thermogemmatispora carboxidivorans]|uniref:CAP domain-containing protein n=1 Tax=Thermogemmatispora carboxidivorans TaxID=1382306 RepID=UPI00069AC1CC|nr:CAP domain-containing protein [Thermogemmatispora carboxidivorans]